MATYNVEIRYEYEGREDLWLRVMAHDTARHGTAHVR